MRPEDSDPARLWDIVRWGGRLERLLAHITWEQYQIDEATQTAVERCIEVIGEAARHLSEQFKQQHPDVPWREIVQQRNVIAHGYFLLDHHRLWRVATVEVPQLVQRLASLVNNPPPDPEPDGSAQ
jgi:uncharacterized protein with HEPN domain